MSRRESWRPGGDGHRRGAKPTHFKAIGRLNAISIDVEHCGNLT